MQPHEQQPPRPRLEVGESASVSKTITEADVVLFAGISTDTNPLHLDEGYARRTRFGGRIAHGMLTAGLISAVIGTRLPGPGAIYLSQTLEFTAPVRIGETITATAKVIKARERRGIYTLETTCTNQDGAVVLRGEAVILYEPV